MYIITVIPLNRKIPFQELTYFYAEPLSTGVLVEIPFQKKNIIALVLSSTSLFTLKAEIKGRPYSLKKINKVLSNESFFWKSVLEAAREVSELFLVQLSHLLDYCTNDFIREYSSNSIQQEKKSSLEESPALLFGTKKERINKIKRIIRESFAKKESIVIIAPTITSVESLYETIKTGIQPSTFLLHSKIKTKEKKQLWKEIQNRSTPFCLIATPHFGLVPSSHVGHIILEEDSHFLYERTPAGELPIREFFITFAQKNNTCITLSDTFPRFESIWKYNPEIRIPRDYTPQSLVFIPKEKANDMLEPYIKKIVKLCIKEKKSLFIYTNRKGFAPISRCTDCGTEISCNTCNLPMVLRIKRKKDGTQKREFCCLSCGEIRSSDHTLCSLCGGWNIKMNAIGTEGFHNTLSEYVGDTIPIYTIDDNATPDSREIIELMEAIKKKKKYILIGTEKVLPYLSNIDYSIVPVYDRILSTPGTRITEELLRLLYTLQEKTNEYIYISTKDESTFTVSLKEKNIQKIIDEEYTIRKSLLYPPFGNLLVISCTVSASLVDKTRELMTSFFTGIEYTLLEPKKVEQHTMRMEIRLIAQVSNDFILQHGKEITTILHAHKIGHRISLNPERIQFL